MFPLLSLAVFHWPPGFAPTSVAVQFVFFSATLLREVIDFAEEKSMYVVIFVSIFDQFFNGWNHVQSFNRAILLHNSMGQFLFVSLTKMITLLFPK